MACGITEGNITEFIRHGICVKELIWKEFAGLAAIPIVGK